MAAVATPFAVLRAGGSASDVGVVAAARLVPTIIFLLFGGVISDRLPRQQVMVAANVAAGMVQATFAVLVLTGCARIWEMAALSAVGGCAMGFFYPAAQGLLPQTVDAADLASANATARLAINGAQIGGSALGGLVVAAFGPGWGLVADAATFALSSVMRTRMRLPRLQPAHAPGFAHELREGWQAFISRRWLWAIVVQFGFSNAVFNGVYLVLGPVVAERRLGGAGSWGVILAARALGSVLGAGVMVRWRPRRLLFVATAAVPLLALPLLGLSASLPLAAVAALALIAGVAGDVFGVNWTVALQEQIPPGMLSRVSSYDALGSYALAPLGALLAGPIALAIGTAATLTAGAGAVLGAALAVLCVGEVRTLTRRPRVGCWEVGGPVAIAGADESQNLGEGARIS
jgi:predicted MFS family arabinose efflux permease